MAKLTRNFNRGVMNKVVDERLLPDGQYIDALNVRMGSTELSNIGSIENTKGNTKLTTLVYIDGTPLSNEARTIGAFEDGANETVYWFVHDSNFPVGATGKLDLIVSFNILTNILTYHVISIDNGGGVDTTLNFNEKYVITGVNKIDDLLYWTDDYNPPRFINVKDNYPNPSSGNIDYYVAPTGTFPDVLKERLQVIKKPPVQSPEIQLVNLPGQENFLEERFICFAYRYRYENNEYSAISQFSEPAFMPEAFSFSNSSYSNDGMINAFNTAIITYNTGGPLVVGVDLLFKEMESNVIRVIEKLDKSELGLSDNTDYTYSFSNSKIYTILPESEILRLYDNVPLLAKAQTMMGNRLMYGNYLEGYDLLDKNGHPVRFEYSTSLNSQEIGLTELENTLILGSYNIDGLVTVNNAVIEVDLSGITLNQGSYIAIDFTLAHSKFSGSTPWPTQTNNIVQISFIHYLSQDFASVFDMVSDTSFQEAVGVVTNVSPIVNSCLGTTLSDAYNCSMLQTLDTYTKYTSGINTANLLVSATGTSGSDIISFQFPAVAYVDNITTPTYTVYEYMQVSSASCSFQSVAQNQSLHSNRDYEIGIVYMDDFNRSTTALVSQDNTEHVPCANSSTKNSIYVTIPDSQIAPYWATRYKFVIKADRDTYETIYTTLFFIDPENSDVYFLLEGENTRKVTVGDRLIVKTDSLGPLNNCAYATVLEVASQAADFLTIPSPSSPTTNIPVPAGVYMKMKPTEFSAIFNEYSFVTQGTKTDSTGILFNSPIVDYLFSYYDSATTSWIDYDIPKGTIINMTFKFKRGKEGGIPINCHSRIYTLEKTLVSQGNYNNMYDWFIGDNIANLLDDGTSYVSGTGNCPIANSFNPILGTSALSFGLECTNQYRFYRPSPNGPLFLSTSGTQACGNTANRRSSLEVNFEILRSNVFVFETEPSDSLPDVFFENELSFEINSLGEHQGNIQNQNFTTGSPAVIDTGFFNCYAFGNGVESYKIYDSIKSNYMLLGNRVTSIAAEDYRAIRRYADITYSGIYNNESNVNKLNEFNLGLLNFKQCERSFGPIYILDARQTDVLTLQEDKISYVLAGKNLLSDAAAGGALTSVPEVLGTQIARAEKYGISFNPESYVQWGQDRYFTDVKRGAVINLKDNETGMSQLQVISENGMSTWFRDLFNTDFDTQKLGGYDPYSDEYVLSSNNQLIPTVSECLSCGTTQEFVLSGSEKITEYCVNLGNLVGDVNIVYNVTSIDPLTESFELTADYNGTIYTTGTTTTSGTLTINKDSIPVETVDIQISSVGSVVLEVTVNCPEARTITVFEVVLTANVDAGQSIVSQWRYTDGSYTGSLQSNLVIFSSGVNPIVSRYNSVSGPQGAANIPTDGSTVRMISNKVFPTNFDFDTTQNKFRYLRTNTLYNNNSVEINALVAASSIGTTSGGGTYYYADVPAGTNDDYLYLIWDLRDSIAVDLCWSGNPLDVDYVCCDCEPCSDPCREWSLQNAGLGSATVNYTDCDGVPQTVVIPEGRTDIICGLATVSPSVISGGVIVTISQECGCRD